MSGRATLARFIANQASVGIVLSVLAAASFPLGASAADSGEIRSESVDAEDHATADADRVYEKGSDGGWSFALSTSALIFLGAFAYVCVWVCIVMTMYRMSIRAGEREAANSERNKLIGPDTRSTTEV